MKPSQSCFWWSSVPLTESVGDHGDAGLDVVKVPLVIYRGTPLDDWVTRVAREGHRPPPNPLPSLWRCDWRPAPRSPLCWEGVEAETIRRAEKRGAISAGRKKLWPHVALLLLGLRPNGSLLWLGLLSCFVLRPAAARCWLLLRQRK